MRKVASILAIIFVFFSSFELFAQMEEPLLWSSKVEQTGEDVYKLTFSAEIESGWGIYSVDEYKNGPNGTKFSFQLPEGVKLDGELTTVSQVKRAFDEIFNMEIGKLYQTAIFEQKVVSKDGGVVKAVVEWQACNDMSCLPPSEHEFTLPLGAKKIEATVAQGQKSEITTTTAGDNSSLWSTIIEAILWGFAALLTPCVFPMVPMTVSFFMKESASKSKGRALASLYGFFIVLLYTLPIAVLILATYFIGGDAITADIFNYLATHWLPNVIFFLVFMLFAASFFGAFEIVLPSSLVNKSDSNSEKGGIVGIFFMALTLVLVSFSCTGPIVGSILVKSTQGEIWSPIVTMLAFSAAFALPFTLFAFFPSMIKSLPKSGGWLNSVKVVLGFIELALGLKFLSVADQTYHWGLLDREIYIALWIVIFTLLGFYLLGKIKFAHDSEMPYLKVKRLFLAIITFTFVVYLIPGMFGAPLKALSGYLPPMHTLDFNLASARASTSALTTNNSVVKYGDKLHIPHGIAGFFDYEEAREYAKKVGKPLFLDFTGHGCVNCREMEANVWSDSKVQQILNDEYVVVALYTDDKLTIAQQDWVTTSSGKVLKSLGKINANFQVEKFGVNAQPYYVLLDEDGEMLSKPRGYDLNVAGFVEFLEEGIENFKIVNNK